MTSPSDTESNLSGFMRYNEKEFKPLYMSIIQVIFNLHLLIVNLNDPSIFHHHHVNI